MIGMVALASDPSRGNSGSLGCSKGAKEAKGRYKLCDLQCVAKLFCASVSPFCKREMLHAVQMVLQRLNVLITIKFFKRAGQGHTPVSLVIRGQRQTDLCEFSHLGLHRQFQAS